MEFEKSCGAVIYRVHNKEIQYLIISHQSDRHWGFPKGHVEKKETEGETAIREIIEETGLKVKLLPNFKKKVEYSPKENVSKQVIYFLAKVNEETVDLQVEEISDFKWLGYSDAMNIITYESSKEVLKQANNHVINNLLGDI